METTKKQLRNRILLFFGAAVCLGLSWYLPLLFVPFAAVLIAANCILFIHKSKFFFVLSALILLSPLATLGDRTAVIFAVFIAAATAGILAALRVKKFLLAVAFAGLACVFGLAIPAITYLSVYHATAPDPSNGKFVSSYLKENADRYDVMLLARMFYANKPDDGGRVLTPQDDGYDRVANEYFSAAVNAWAEEELFFFVMGHAVLTAILSFIAAYYLYKSFGSVPDEPEELPKEPLASPEPPDPFASAPAKLPEETSLPSVPAVSLPRRFVRTEYKTVDNLSLGRNYVWYVFIPVSLLSFLGYVPHFAPATIAFFNALVVVPCFFAAISLFLFAAFKIPKKGIRIPVVILIVLLMGIGFIFPIGMLIFALFGLADAILGVRKLLNFALS